MRDRASLANFQFQKTIPSQRISCNTTETVSIRERVQHYIYKNDIKLMHQSGLFTDQGPDSQTMSQDLSYDMS